MGKILSAEKVKKQTSFCSLLLIRDDTRTVVSGIAQHYSREMLLVKRFWYCNLSQEDSVESRMVLMAENEEGLSFLETEKEFLHGIL